MAKDELGDRIQKLREARGFSASELARLVDVTPTAVWNWEKNGVQPRTEMLNSVAKVLGTTADYLLVGDVAFEVADVDKTAASIVEAARLEIARATGFPLDRVSISVAFTSSGH